MTVFRPTHAGTRNGAAAVEFAVAFPLILVFFIGLCDLARVFYYSLAVANCARNGAAYLSDQVAAENSPYESVEEAALADAIDLSPTPTITTATGTDTAGDKYVQVTVSYPFTMASRLPWFSEMLQLRRTVRMRLARELPPDE